MLKFKVVEKVGPGRIIGGTAPSQLAAISMGVYCVVCEKLIDADKPALQHEEPPNVYICIPCADDITSVNYEYQTRGF